MANIPKVTGDVQHSRIDTSFVGGIQGKPVAPNVSAQPGSYLKWNGTQWTPDTLTRYWGVISAAQFPPTSSPRTGDTVDVQIPTGIIWRFVYNSPSNPTYPWQFIGGAPVIVEITSYAFGQLTTWTPFNGVAWGVPSQLQGQYVVSGGYSGQNAASGAATVRAGVMINFGSGYNAPQIYAGSAQSASFDFNIKVGTRYYLFNTGTTTVAMGYWVNAFPTIVNAWIEILPLNVS